MKNKELTKTRKQSDKTSGSIPEGYPKNFVRYEQGAKLFDISLRQFIYLVKKIHREYKECVYQPGRVVWVDVRIVEEYILSHPL